MKERLTIRVLKSRIEKHLDSYEELDRKWIKSISWPAIVIQGYLEDHAFARFVEYIKIHAGYCVNYIDRKYSKNEIRDAAIFTLSIDATFEPTGEELGTEYLSQCSECKIREKGAGPLKINTARIPKTADIAKTIARDEWVVNGNVRRLLSAGHFSGFTLEEVNNISRSRVSSPWYQLQVNSLISLSSQTRYGDSFKPNVDINSIRSRCGHVIKDLAYSELFVDKYSWDGSDICVTNYHYGGHVNLIYPFQYIVISKNLYTALTESNIKGYSVEIAHLV